MAEPEHLFHIHRDRKYGGFDFGVSCVVGEFTLQEMKDFREMLVVAMGVAEDMFRRENEKRNLAQCTGGNVKGGVDG